jgi:hypothetical protein
VQLSEISSDSVTNDLDFGLKPGYAVMQSMRFQTNKGTDCQTDMITLRDFEPKLTAFNAGAGAFITWGRRENRYQNAR